MSFAVFHVNWWAVLVSGVAYFAIGAAWYGFLAEPWMKGIGKTRDELESKPTDYIVSLICEILVAYFVAVALGAFGAAGVLDAIFVGAVVWFGFSLLPTIVHYAYEDRTFSLLAINKGYDFVGIEIAAIILSVWQ
jgi:hypothetical protein